MKKLPFFYQKAYNVSQALPTFTKFYWHFVGKPVTQNNGFHSVIFIHAYDILCSYTVPITIPHPSLFDFPSLVISLRLSYRPAQGSTNEKRLVILVFLSLTYLACHDELQFHLFSYKCHDLYGWKFIYIYIFTFIYKSHCVYPCIHWIYNLAIVNNAAINMDVQIKRYIGRNVYVIWKYYANFYKRLELLWIFISAASIFNQFLVGAKNDLSICQSIHMYLNICDF